MSKSSSDRSGKIKASDSFSCKNYQQMYKRNVIATVLFLGVAVSSLSLYHSAYYPIVLLPSYYAYRHDFIPPLMKFQPSSLEGILKKAEMKNKTVILTTLSEAWAEPNSIFDIFMESFRVGNGTRELLNHLVVVSLDPIAHAHCSAMHPHCYALENSGTDFSGSGKPFMSSDYLEMMWIRIRLLTTILKLGYSFVFTDADILWLRNPFQHLYPDGDFQIACDFFFGKQYDLRNLPNGGFNYVKSNNQTIEFYKFWYSSRKNHPGLHDQDVLNKIKFDPFIREIGVNISFLDTKYIAGFCHKKKTDINTVCTMHANCCPDLQAKIRDLKVVLQHWKTFLELSPGAREKSLQPSWSTVPKYCRFPPTELPRNVSQAINNTTKRTP